MTKTIELSDEQFRNLNTLLQLGIIMSSHNVETDNLFHSAQYFFSYSKEFNCGDMVKYSKTDEIYFPTKKMDDIVFPIVESFQDDYFWPELAVKLATKDFEDENSPAAIRKLTDDQKFNAVMAKAEIYENEFYEKGLLNFGRISDH